MQSLLSELKRRKVYHAAAFYAAAAWLLVQVATQVFPFFDLPAIWVRGIIIVAVLGFPVAIGVAWFYEWTPAGFRRESEDERTENIARIVSMALDRRGMSAHSLSLPNVPSSFEQSIAVLPFTDMSEGKDHEYFSDGLAEEVLNLLAQLPQLRVVARTSSFSFKGKAFDVATIASALKVATLLTGSVRKAGRKLRVSAQLIRAADSSHLWTQAFESELTDVFALQDTIARAVVAAMRVKLLRTQRLSNPHRTDHTEAYEQYLIGMDVFRHGRYDDYRRAVPAFESAISLDPDYAPAHAGLAAALSAVADYAPDAEQRTAGKQAALASAEKAIALAPELADGYILRGQIRYMQFWDWKSAEADFQRALLLDPSNTDLLSLYSLALLNIGRSDEAFILIGRATESDPLSWRAWTLYGLILRQIGSTAESRTALERAVEISPDSSFARAVLGLFDLDEGRADAALEHFRRAGGGHSQAGIAMAEHSLGHARESLAALDELKRKYATGFALQIAQVHAWRGENDAAFEWLDKAFAHRDPGLLRLRSDHQLASLKDDRRFAALLRQLNYPD